MKTAYIFPIGLVLVVLVLGGIYMAKSQKTENTYSIPQTTTATDTTSTSTSTATTSIPNTYTSAEIAAHKDAASCWTSIAGGVYDLTTWIAQHPGGERAILSICGKDGTAAFMGQHGGQGRPEQMLATFKIGTLTQ